MTDLICELELCTGCAACFSICPKNCIKMCADNEGFLRPQIDGVQCVECGKCQSICPINHPIHDDGVEPLTYAARVIDDAILEKSSSGGVFSAFADYMLTNGGVVVGAGFDEEFHVVHKLCVDKNDLDDLRRSKYV